jgi:hypothetical protein
MGVQRQNPEHGPILGSKLHLRVRIDSPRWVILTQGPGKES